MSRDLSTVPKPPPGSAEPYSAGPVVLHLSTGVNFEVAEYLDDSDVYQPVTLAWAFQRMRDRYADNAYSLLRSPAAKVSRVDGGPTEIGYQRSLHLLWWRDVVTAGRVERHGS